MYKGPAMAAKTAKKKTAKRKAPSRPCVKCKKPVHPRSKTCPACGAAQPAAKKAVSKKAVSKKAVSKKAVRKAPSTKKAVSVVSQIAKAAADIEIMESKLAAKRKELGKLVAKL